MFTKLYLDTTNPKSSISQLFTQNAFSLFISIVLHIIVYSLFFNLASFIFYGSVLSSKINRRLIISLLIIMTFGYIARFYHVKDIYNAYDKDMEKTRNHLDKLYISWIFVA